MTLAYLNKPFSYDSPEISVIRASRSELIRKLSIREDLYLPILNQQLNSLETLLYGVDNEVRESLVAAPARLQIDEAEDLTSRMHDAARLKPSHFAESKIKTYQAALDALVNSALEETEARALVLTQRLDELSGWSMADVKPFISDHDQQIAQLQKTLPPLKAELDKLDDNKRHINAAMRVYEDKTVLDRWTPILEDLLKIRDSSIPMATLKGAVAGVANILRIASEAVRYENLVEARERAEKLRGEMKTQIHSVEDQIKVLNTRNEQLHQLDAIGEVAQRYEQQARKVADALTTFLTLREQRANEPAGSFARTYITHAEALSAWLNSLRKLWK